MQPQLSSTGSCLLHSKELARDCASAEQEGLGGTPKVADASLRDMHHVTRASNSQSSLSSMGSRMLASTKLTLLDLIHQYKASRASTSDAAAVQQRRKVRPCAWPL